MEAWQEMHGEAMEKSDAAVRLHRVGEHLDQADTLFDDALTMEMKALEQMGDVDEPFYSAMYLSAATLALDGRRYRLAEQLASKALAGAPPDVLLRELRKITHQVRQLMRLRD